MIHTWVVRSQTVSRVAVHRVLLPRGTPGLDPVAHLRNVEVDQQADDQPGFDDSMGTSLINMRGFLCVARVPGGGASDDPSMGDASS